MTSAQARAHLLGPLPWFGKTLLDTFSLTSCTLVQGMFDEGNPHGLQQYGTSDFLRSFGDEAVIRLTEAGTTPSSAMTQILLRRLKGRIADGLPRRSRSRPRNADYILTVAASKQNVPPATP